MSTKLYTCLLVASMVLAGGCADMDDVPRVVRDAMKDIPYAEGSAISFLQKPVQKGFSVTFVGDEAGPITVPGEGYLVWIDENSGVRWPHPAKLVWVPKAPDQAHRILKQGSLSAAFRIQKDDGSPIGRMIWNTL